MSAHVYRASFARFTVTSRTTDGTCDECGNSNRHGRVRIFTIESDGGRDSDIEGAFCSASCCKAYHDIDDRWGEA